MSHTCFLPTCLIVGLWLLASTSIAAQPPTEGTVAVPQNRQPQSLKEVVDEIVWKPQQQGLLLIVSPSTVTHDDRWTRRTDGAMVPPSEAFLPPRSEQGLRLSTLEQYFSRVVVPCGDVTVLAPAKMMVLNYENLPQPSAFTGLKPNDSFQLLQGLLTKAQWQKVASPNGLGIGDLDSDQRELFLAAFPTDMTVCQTRDGKFDATKLQDNQRLGIRFRVVRTMNWLLKSSDGGYILPDLNPDRTYLSIRNRTDWETQQRQAFGVELLSEVSARFKPGQLAFEWEGLNAPVDLTDVETVGEVVERVRKVTQVELYCDPRYARLPVYLRGERARAGNVLKALARGVTGTWRRLENAFVLTDDLTGLGARYARILDWMNRNMVLGARVDSRIVAALTEIKPAQYVAFSEDDTSKPSDKLLREYQEYQTELRSIRLVDRPDTEKTWAVTKLPSSMQEQIKRQAQKIAEDEYRRNVTVNFNAAVLKFNTAAEVNVPGITGWFEAPHTTDIMRFNDESSYGALPQRAEPWAEPILAAMKVRVLAVDIKKDENWNLICQEARRAGFTEIWAEADVAAPDTLKGAIRSAHAAKLKFRALVPALRRKPAKSIDDGVDVNILGETSTQYLGRILQQGTLPIPFYYDDISRSRARAEMEPVAVQERQRGDWLDPAAPYAAALVVQRVEDVLKTAAVDGIVLRDVTPPGYLVAPGALSNPQFGNIERGGYSVARRLAFLRETGVDPVDLSTIGDTGFNQSSGQRLRQLHHLALELPNFPHHGVDNVLQEWDKFRQDSMQNALTKIQDGAQKAAGNIPVWISQNTSRVATTLGHKSYVESWDKTSLTASGVAKDATRPSVPPPVGVLSDWYSFPPVTRDRSSTVLFGFDVLKKMRSLDPPPPGLNPGDAFLMKTNQLFDSINFWAYEIKDYDGFVFDATGETTGDVVAIIAAMPTPKEVPGPANNDKGKPAVNRPVKSGQSKTRGKRP